MQICKELDKWNGYGKDMVQSSSGKLKQGRISPSSMGMLESWAAEDRPGKPDGPDLYKHGPNVWSEVWTWLVAIFDPNKRKIIPIMFRTKRN